MRNRSITLLGILVAVASASSPLRADTIFLNGEEPTGVSTPFSDTVGPIQATFTCIGTAATCQTSSTTISGFPYVNWSPEMLWTTATGIPDTMTIVFNTTLSSISLQFGALDPNNPGSADTMVLQAFSGGLGGTAAGSNSSTGTLNASDQLPYQGTLSVSGSFNAVTITDTTNAMGLFAIGVVDVTTGASSTPEPSYFSVFPALGLGAAWLKRRRARS